MFIQIGPKDYIPLSDIYTISETNEIYHYFKFRYFPSIKQFKELTIKLKNGDVYRIHKGFEDIVLLWAKKNLVTLDLTGTNSS